MAQLSIHRVRGKFCVLQPVAASLDGKCMPGQDSSGTVVTAGSCTHTLTLAAH
jgi:hypothetical protein